MFAATIKPNNPCFLQVKEGIDLNGAKVLDPVKGWFIM